MGLCLTFQQGNARMTSPPQVLEKSCMEENVTVAKSLHCISAYQPWTWIFGVSYGQCADGKRCSIHMEASSDHTQGGQQRLWPGPSHNPYTTYSHRQMGLYQGLGEPLCINPRGQRVDFPAPTALGSSQMQKQSGTTGRYHLLLLFVKPYMAGHIF